MNVQEGAKLFIYQFIWRSPQVIYEFLETCTRPGMVLISGHKQSGIQFR